jgi:hypothetical protein
MKYYLIKFDQYIGYHWDDNEKPEQELYYTADRITQALRRFRAEYPGYALNSIRRI